jgi:hypothetical protein
MACMFVVYDNTQYPSIKRQKNPILMWLHVLFFLWKSVKFREGNIYYQYGSMNPQENLQIKRPYIR